MHYSSGTCSLTTHVGEHDHEIAHRSGSVGTVRQQQQRQHQLQSHRALHLQRAVASKMEMRATRTFASFGEDRVDYADSISEPQSE
jgi:hypothetical protein